MVLYLLNTRYDKEQNQVVCYLYDDVSESIVQYRDTTDFRSFCFTSIPPEQFYNYCQKNVRLTQSLGKINPTEPTKKRTRTEAYSVDPEADENEQNEDEIDEPIDDTNEELETNNDDEPEITNEPELIKSDPVQIPEKTDDELLLKDTNMAIDPSSLDDYIPIQFRSLPIETVEKHHALSHSNKVYTKIYGKTPLDIADRWGNTGVNISDQLILRDGDHIVDNYAYENNIPFHHNYVFDKQLVFGMPYDIKLTDCKIMRPDECEQCFKSNGLYSYYIRKTGTESNQKGVILGKIVCQECGNILFEEKSEVLQQYQLYFTVEREFDLKPIIKKTKFLVSRNYPVDPKIQAFLEEEFKHESPEEQNLMHIWSPYFFSPIPDMLRAGFDIETYSISGKFGFAPDKIKKAPDPVSSASFVDIHGKKITYCFKGWKEIGTPIKEMPSDVQVTEFKTERELLVAVFERIAEYPLLITFNGTNFDLPYLYFRAIHHCKIKKEDIPYTVKDKRTKSNGSGIQINFDVIMDCNLHLDLMIFFAIKSLRVYAFKNAYPKVSLLEVTKALLPTGDTKVSEFILNPDGTKKALVDYTKHELTYYNHIDAKVTLQLTTYDNNIVMILLFIMMRLSKCMFDDFVSHQISFWIKNMLHFEHRRMNWIIPQEAELRKITTYHTQSLTKNKKFEGAYVKQPIAGIFFDVTVLDFASLYPSIVKQRNLSYETVDCCNHPECKTNIVPFTKHWVCMKHKGILALAIGLIRDFRVMYFKKQEGLNKTQIEICKKEGKLDEATKLSDLNKFYNVVQNVLKVFINAGFGVFANDTFYYCQLGVGESIPSYGRDSISQIEDRSEKYHHVQVNYSDTDSIFLVNPSKAIVEDIIRFALEKLHLDLEVDKEFKYVAMSTRKKNYFGSFKQKPNITPDMKLWKLPEIKGLSGKKVNTPQYIKNAFKEIVKYLDINLNKPEDIDNIKKYMSAFFRNTVTKMNKFEFEINEMGVNMKLSKDVVEYGKPIEVRQHNQKCLEKAKNGTIKRNPLESMILTQKSTGNPKQDQLILAYQQFRMDGFPEIAKCALQLLKNGLRVEKGELMTIIKTTTKEKALPIQLIKNKTVIDIEKYLEILYSTLDQVYDCFQLSTGTSNNQGLT